MNTKLVIAALVFVANAATTATAGPVVFTENFNSGITSGSSLTSEQYSERWANTDYYLISSTSLILWSFSGVTPILAVNLDDTTNRALLLNEPSAVATRTLTGLSPSLLYKLSFNLSGDNRPGLLYTVLLDVNGGNLLNVTSSWTLPSGGTTQTVYFTPDASGNALLKFYQGSSTSASPIVDDIVVSVVPDGGATLALLGGALMGLGLLRRMFRV